MLAYVINLDTATDRWKHMTVAFQATDLRLIRVSAVDGNSMILPADQFNPSGYHRRHGREINIFEVACYLSHLKALAAFLDGGVQETAIILEDDVTPATDVNAITREALNFSGKWDILRLSGLSRGSPVRVGKLTSGHSICVNLARLKGAGAYMINRKAAQRFLNHLLPITLPYDHAMDREWCWGLKAAYVLPFPISQTACQFRSSIQHNSKRKLSCARRLATTYPYQAFNELHRYIFRICSFATWNNHG
jgi:glycosyl transferase family 25